MSVDRDLSGRSSNWRIDVNRFSYGTAVSRAFHLRCPRCGEGALFRNLITMNERCPACSLKYERAPGYFLGSTYVNYGFMALTMTGMYMALHFGAGISNEVLTAPLLVYCVVMPIILFRYARAWWLTMDCFCDPSSFGIPAGSASDEASAKVSR
jgi:uncharacterized protein (DUF983 family)